MFHQESKKTEDLINTSKEVSGVYTCLLPKSNFYDQVSGSLGKNYASKDSFRRTLANNIHFGKQPYFAATNMQQTYCRVLKIIFP